MGLTSISHLFPYPFRAGYAADGAKVELCIGRVAKFVSLQDKGVTTSSHKRAILLTLVRSTNFSTNRSKMDS